MAQKRADPNRKYKFIKDISKNFLQLNAKKAKNMTRLISLLGFSDGDTQRIKIKELIRKFEIDISHFKSRPSVPDHIKLQRRKQSNARQAEKRKLWRKNLERREMFIYNDTRRSDKKRGFKNDLSHKIIADLIKDGCSYCKTKKGKMGLDRIDNTLGHQKSNVVAACTRCNLIKGSMPYKAWLFLVPNIKECYEKGLFGNWMPGNKSGQLNKSTTSNKCFF